MTNAWRTIVKVFKWIPTALAAALADEGHTEFAPPYTPGYRLAMTTHGKAPRLGIAQSYVAVNHSR